MNDQTKTSTVCPQCGAQKASADDQCWLCYANPYAAPAEVVVPRPEFTAGEAIDWFATITILALVFLIGLGIFIDEPWATIPFAFVMIPGVIGAVLTRARQLRRGVTGFWGSRTVALLSGGITIIVTLVLLVVAAIALLFAICVGYSFNI